MQWRSKNTARVMYTIERRLEQALILFNCIPFQMGTFLKESSWSQFFTLWVAPYSREKHFYHIKTFTRQQTLNAISFHMCYGYSRDSSHGDSSFESPEHVWILVMIIHVRTLSNTHYFVCDQFPPLFLVTKLRKFFGVPKTFALVEGEYMPWL